jgi:hypothetical protein
LLQQLAVQSGTVSPVVQAELSVTHTETAVDAEVGRKPRAVADVDANAGVVGK